MTKTAIVIPSYCSLSNLRAHLPYLLEEVRSLGVRVIVSDDASPDDTADRVAEEFPEVQLLRRETNGGFGENCNSAIRSAKGFDRVLLLNTDVKITPGFLQPLEAHFDDPTVFSVSSVAVDPESDLVVDGARLAEFRRGLFKWRKVDHERLREAGAHVTTYPVGAHVLFDRAKFLELGGFDPLFRPFYWEDVDLGYRALKRGWRTLVEPASRVHHLRERSDIERASVRSVVAHTIYRNRFLFLWKNLHDKDLFWGAHVLPIACRCLYSALLLDHRFYRALISALARGPSAVRARHRAQKEALKTDRAVLEGLRRALWPGSRR